MPTTIYILIQQYDHPSDIRMYYVFKDDNFISTGDAHIGPRANMGRGLIWNVI